MEKTEAILKEMSPQELLSVNGGDPIGTLVRRFGKWAVLSLGIYVYDNWDQFVDGVKEGYESTQNN